MSLKVISKISSGSDPDMHLLMKLDPIREKTVRLGYDSDQLPPLQHHKICAKIAQKTQNSFGAGQKAPKQC